VYRLLLSWIEVGHGWYRFPDGSAEAQDYA
jgi:hypothetical protein